MVTIAGSRVVEMFESSGRNDSATVACRNAFATRGDTEFEVADLPLESTLKTYRQRFGRPWWDPSTVLGADRFLRDLERVTDPTTAFVSLEFEGLSFMVWLDQTASRLISCMVGRDRRYKSRVEGDWAFTGDR